MVMCNSTFVRISPKPEGNEHHKTILRPKLFRPLPMSRSPGGTAVECLPVCKLRRPLEKNNESELAWRCEQIYRTSTINHTTERISTQRQSILDGHPEATLSELSTSRCVCPVDHNQSSLKIYSKTRCFCAQQCLQVLTSVEN